METEQAQGIQGSIPGMAQLGTNLAVILMEKSLMMKVAIPLHCPTMETLLPSVHALMMGMETIQAKQEFIAGVATLGAS